MHAQIATAGGIKPIWLLTHKTSPERQICGGREGPGSPGDDIVTDGGGRRVIVVIVEQVMFLRVKHSISALHRGGSPACFGDKM